MIDFFNMNIMYKIVSFVKSSKCAILLRFSKLIINLLK